MGLFTNLFSSIVPKPQSSKKQVVYLSGDGSYAMDITGEGDHQAALEDLCGPRLPQGVNQLETAWLVVNDNRTDSNKNAVRVEIRGGLVGFLSLEDTIRYRRYLNAKGMPKAQGQCRAVIKGGWVDSDGGKGPYYVALDILALTPEDLVRQNK
jgi:hypothetical protein